MAPENNAVPAVIRTASMDVTLAQKAAAFLGSALPQKSHEQIVNELLDRLQREKHDRESKGLNHWEEYAPQYLKKLVVRHRRASVAAFIAAEHDKAFDFVLRITREPDAAEAALGRTYVELLEGKTSEKFFYRALKLNARNEMRKRRLQHRRFESLDGLRGRRFSVG